MTQAESTHTYRVLAVQMATTHTEEIRTYEATSLGEALAMAERADAGLRDCIYGVVAGDFDIARAEGIQFNEADGLLV